MVLSLHTFIYPHHSHQPVALPHSPADGNAALDALPGLPAFADAMIWALRIFTLVQITGLLWRKKGLKRTLYTFLGRELSRAR